MTWRARAFSMICATTLATFSFAGALVIADTQTPDLTNEPGSPKTALPSNPCDADTDPPDSESYAGESRWTHSSTVAKLSCTPGTSEAEGRTVTYLLSFEVNVGAEAKNVEYMVSQDYRQGLDSEKLANCSDSFPHADVYYVLSLLKSVIPRDEIDSDDDLLINENGAAGSGCDVDVEGLDEKTMMLDGAEPCMVGQFTRYVVAGGAAVACVDDGGCATYYQEALTDVVVTVCITDKDPH